jgi:hypothetical protein
MIVRCNTMSMTDKEIRCSSTGTATAAVSKALQMVCCNAMAWTDEKQEYNYPDPVACTMTLW